MNKIEELIEKLCPDGVEIRELGEVVLIANGQLINKKEIEKNIGIYPVINSGKEPLGYISKWNTEDDPIGITTRGAGVGTIIWTEGKYFRGNLNYSVTIKDKNLLNVRFLYYILLNKRIEIASLCKFTGIPALNASDLKTLEIPIPPIEIQEKIVEIINPMIKLQEALEYEKELRIKQYNYYRDKLLSFEGIEDVEWKELGEVVQYSKDRIDYSLLNSENYVGVDNLLQNAMGKTTSEHAPIKGRFTKFYKQDVLIGNIRPYLKKIWFSDIEGGASQDVLVIRTISDRILPRYLYTALKTDDFFIYNVKHSKTGKMPRGNKEKILKYKIPIPPLSEQQKIAEILDKFEELIRLLEREIDLRQKQYEYYREKLLNFKIKA